MPDPVGSVSPWREPAAVVALGALAMLASCWRGVWPCLLAGPRLVVRPLPAATTCWLLATACAVLLVIDHRCWRRAARWSTGRAHAWLIAVCSAPCSPWSRWAGCARAGRGDHLGSATLGFAARCADGLRPARGLPCRRAGRGSACWSCSLRPRRCARRAAGARAARPAPVRPDRGPGPAAAADLAARRGHRRCLADRRRRGRRRARVRSDPAGPPVPPTSGSGAPPPAPAGGAAAPPTGRRRPAADEGG